MAYNILKGNVQFSKSTTGSIESMVDDYSDQSVGGVKTFTSAITASAFYDSTAGAPVTASPIENVYGAAEGRVAIFSGSTGLSGSANLTYDSVTTTLSILANISSSATISGSSFFGTAVGLTELQATEITGTVSAANINIGNGLNNNAGALEVSASNPSMNIASNGISVNTGGSNSGILLDGGSGLRVDPSRATTVGSLNNTDLFMTSTTGSLFNASIGTLQTYMQNTLSFGAVAGSDTQVQFNSSGDFGANSNFTFDGNTLAVPGVSSSANISASHFYGSGQNLTNIDAANIVGNVSAANINIGDGLYNNAGALSVSGSTGINVTPNGVEVTASATSGLNVTLANGLAVDPVRATSTGSVEGPDVILISDNSDSGNLKSATLSTVSNYMQSALTFTTPGGSNTQVQYNNSGGFAGSSAFIFNAATETVTTTNLTASGHVSASSFHGNGSALVGVTATATPAGSNTEIQINTDGVTGATSDFTFVTSSNSLFVSGNISASHIVPNADQQYDIGQETLGYENLYAKYLNGGISITVQNDEGASITKGKVVYIKGIVGGTPTVGLAACDDSNKMPAFGLVADGTIANGSTGRIVTFGDLTSVDTSAFSQGDTLFVQTGSGGVSGSLTNSAPTGSGNLLQNIGKVLESAASGRVKVGGAGRTNATPNLDKGYIFVGNDSDQSVQDNTVFISSSANLVGINNTDPDHALTVTGDISASLNISASAFYGSVSYLDVVEIASSTTVIDGTQFSSSLNLSASAFYGDGSNLSGIGGGTAWNAFTASYNVLSSYDVMGINTSGSVVTASLPGAADLSAGKRLVFKDVGGSGSANNIVIEASGSQTIDGASTVKIQANYGAITLSTDGVAAFYIISTT